MKKDTLSTKIDIRFCNLLQKIATRYKKMRYDAKKRKDDRIWNNLFQTNPSFIHQLNQGLSIHLYNDSIISRLIYDGFEENEVSFLKDFLRPDDIFFDIGANIGLFSLVASQIVGQQGKIYSFEPTPETYRRLNENIKINEFKNILSYQIGLSDAEGELLFHTSQSGYDAWNSFANLKQLENGNIIPVSTTTIDQFIQKHNIDVTNIKMIKIDVEGWEMNVLKGASETLKQKVSPLLMVEFTEDNAFSAGYYCSEIFDFVRNSGYEWYKYDSAKKELTIQEKKLHYPYENLFATKDIDFVRKFIK